MNFLKFICSVHISILSLELWNKTYLSNVTSFVTMDAQFLPRCMHCVQCSLVTIKLSVCLSVRPSVKRVDCDKMQESSA